MTRAFPGQELAQRVVERLPSSVEGWEGNDLRVKEESLVDVCRFLKETPDLGFDFLVAITAVDYVEYFEMVYHLMSIRRNHSAVLKVRVYNRENPSVPSLVSLWQGADFQEREVWDLMGVSFAGHQNMKRILTWEGFPGHPLRKDFLG